MYWKLDNYVLVLLFFSWLIRADKKLTTLPINRHGDLVLVRIIRPTNRKTIVDVSIESYQ